MISIGAYPNRSFDEFMQLIEKSDLFVIDDCLFLVDKYVAFDVESFLYNHSLCLWGLEDDDLKDVICLPKSLDTIMQYYLTHHQKYQHKHNEFVKNNVILDDNQ